MFCVQGCLLVCSDELLCPRGTVLLRKSMLKMAGAKWDLSTGDYSNEDFFFAVNNTFEQQLNKNDVARLNKNCILLLHALKVPFDVFDRLMKVLIF